MEKWKQQLHTEPPHGWLNDPNGLSFFKGKYHVFFQHSPHAANGETPRCWGHCSGESLTRLEYNGTALSPDIPEDRDGVYSGSAVSDGETLHIFYTGNVKEDGEHDYVKSGRGANVIHVTTKDGYTMSEKRVVLRNSDYPGFCSCHVRDPKIFRDGNIWKMLLGARTLDDSGCVLIYRSSDLEKWEYENVIFTPGFGYMWECPDYFTIGGRKYLSVSPQGLPHYEIKYQNIFQSGYFPVHGRLEDNSLGEFTEWDMGFDFYAPQSFEAPDGRRILIGWLGMGGADYGNATVKLGRQHCLTLPREITADENGRLLQNPIAELNALRANSSEIASGVTVNTELPFDLYGKTSGGFDINLDRKLNMHFDEYKCIFTLEFKDYEYGCERTVRRAALSECKDIRIIADRSSLEIFLNGGSTVMSTRFYPADDTVNLTVNGLSATKWSI